MLSRRATKEEALRLFKESDSSEPEHYVFAYAIWCLLSGAAKDTLNALVSAGPLHDGDVPSKSGRDELLDFGLVSKVCVKGKQGFQAANYLGWRVLKAGMGDGS